MIKESLDPTKLALVAILFRRGGLTYTNGDTQNPVYRSRLAGKEFRTHNDDNLYTATPLLEALRFVLSKDATRRYNNDYSNGERRVFMVNDVSRAYVNAVATRDLCIDIPKEDTGAKPGEFVHLKVCLYGTRDAALNWQR